MSRPSNFLLRQVADQRPTTMPVTFALMTLLLREHNRCCDSWAVDWGADNDEVRKSETPMYFSFTVTMLVLKPTCNLCCCYTCRGCAYIDFYGIAAHDSLPRGLGGDAPVSTASKLLVRLREDTWGSHAPPNKKASSAINMGHDEKRFEGSPPPPPPVALLPRFP